ncbi:C2 domain-containing protein At1g53590 [Coffea arabica]|uniref:C2 domain-containing protein At1g53590 n=1 Tax=Coffea arabica TaxID=13443 RepID=A0A6P6SCI2_COFAR
MGSVLEATLLHHVGIVLIVLWMLNSFNYCNPVAYFISFVYLFLVHEMYVVRLRKTLEFEEKRNSNQRKILSDSETVRWLNHAVEKMWPVCMEQIVSQKILLPIVPWFLQKYKPWTVKEGVVQELCLGRSPPMFTEMRVLHQSKGDDHLVLELGLNFRTADDMNALLAVKLRKRLGFGMWARLHLLGMHVEGKVLVGVKFIRKWPFLGRVRLCFVEPPYFQMIVKPIFTHGLDVTVLPGIAGWLDKLMAVAFEQTLVEPNMLVVDMEKFASPQAESWFSIDEKQPVAYAVVEVIEAAEMKPSDLNGLADPYVKGQLGPYRFRTKTQKRTLTPKWHEEFKVPIRTWESPNVLGIEVRDKDRFVDDKMGECSINLNESRDGQRHDMWLSLQNVKVGRLHLAITVTEGNGKGSNETFGKENLDEYKRESFATDSTNQGSFSSVTSEKSLKVADAYEPIDVEGQQGTGIWVHRPGSEVAQIWEARKGKSRILDTHIHGEGVDSAGTFKSTASGSRNNDSKNAEETAGAEKEHSPNAVKRGLHKMSSLFHRGQRSEKSVCVEEPLPPRHINLRSMNSDEIGVKFIVDDPVTAPSAQNIPQPDGKESSEDSGPESPHRGKVKDRAKSILKQSAYGIKHALSRKGSKKFYFESKSQPTERDVSVESTTSEEDLLPSVVYTPRVEPISVVSYPISDHDKDSSSPSKNRIQSPSSDVVKDIVIQEEKVIPESKIGDDESGCIQRNEAIEESKSSPKLPGGDMKVDK